MATLGNNVVQIIIQGKDATTPAANSASAALGKLANFAKVAAVSLGAVWSTRAVVNFARAAVDTQDQMGKLAQQAGVTSEFMSELSHHAELNEVATDGMKRAMKELNESIAQNSKELATLGITGRSVEQALPQIADKFADMADGAKKAELATKLFGKAGIDLIPMLNQGSAGLKASAEEARRFGLIVDKEAALAADEFNDNLAKLGMLMRGFANQIMRDMVPSLVAWTGAVLKLNEQHDLLGKSVTSVGVTATGLGMMWEGATGLVGTYITTMTLARQAMENFFDEGAVEGLKGLTNAMAEVLIQAQRIRANMDAKALGFLFDETTKGRFEPDTGAVNVFGKGAKEPPPEDRTEYFKLMNKLRLDNLNGEFDAIARMEEMERQHHSANLERISEQARIHGEANALMELEQARHSKVLLDIETKRETDKRALMQTGLRVTSDVFGSAAALAQAFGKKGFKAWKAFATAQAIVNTYSSAVAAYNALAGIPVIGPALAVAAAAAAIGAGLANVANIQKTEPSGAAHGGMSYVPAESTYMLQRGERVLSPRQNEDITQFIQGDGDGRSGEPIQWNIYLDGSILARGINDMSRDGRLEISARAIV